MRRMWCLRSWMIYMGLWHRTLAFALKEVVAFVFLFLF